jgi:hypothetical protein
LDRFRRQLIAYVTTRMTQEETGAEFTQTFPLVKEDGQWRICL